MSLRRLMMRVAAFGAACALCSGRLALAGGAQDMPPLHPTRDAAIIYRVSASAAGKDQSAERTLKMYWGQEGQKLRAEIPGERAVALVDFAEKRIQLVVADQRLVLNAPFDERIIPGFSFPAGIKATRGGAETVAGFACTDWLLHGPQGDGHACVTDDGVLLRAQGAGAQGSGTMQAVSVTLAPQPASLFVPPADFRRMDLHAPRQ